MTPPFFPPLSFLWAQNTEKRKNWEKRGVFGTCQRPPLFLRSRSGLHLAEFFSCLGRWYGAQGNILPSLVPSRGKFFSHKVAFQTATDYCARIYCARIPPKILLESLWRERASWVSEKGVKISLRLFRFSFIRGPILFLRDEKRGEEVGEIYPRGSHQDDRDDGGPQNKVPTAFCQRRWLKNLPRLRKGGEQEENWVVGGHSRGLNPSKSTATPLSFFPKFKNFPSCCFPWKNFSPSPPSSGALQEGGQKKPRIFPPKVLRGLSWMPMISFFSGQKKEMGKGCQQKRPPPQKTFLFIF